VFDFAWLFERFCFSRPAGRDTGAPDFLQQPEPKKGMWQNVFSCFILPDFKAGCYNATAFSFYWKHCKRIKNKIGFYQCRALF
jgi:hypothetical protein